jgi:hypothetical protein
MLLQVILLLQVHLLVLLLLLFLLLWLLLRLFPRLLLLLLLLLLRQNLLNVLLYLLLRLLSASRISEPQGQLSQLCRGVENSLCCAVNIAAQVDGTGMLGADLVQQVCSPDIVYLHVTIMHWHFRATSAYGLPRVTPIDLCLLLFIGGYAGTTQTMLNHIAPTLQM